MLTETQHKLEKLLPKIHRAADADGNDEVELIYSFSIKLKKSISKDLMSRDFKYKTLPKLISAAQRYELHSETLSGKDYEDLSSWGLNNTDPPEPVAVYSGPMQSRPSPSHFSQDFSHNQYSNPTRSGRPKPGQHNSRNRPNSNFQHHAPTAGNSNKCFSRSTGTSEICNMFNKFKKSTCELPNNKCFYHCLHKCSACQKWGCKACNHKPPGQTDFNKPQAKHQGQAHVASNIATNFGPSPSCEHGPGFPPSDQVSPTQDLTNVLSSMQNSLQSLSVRMEKLERPPAPIPLVAPQLPQTQGLPLALTFHRKFQLMVVQLSQQFPTTFRFRHWTLQINTFCGPLLHLQGSPFPSPLIVAAVCHWSVRLMLMSLLKNIPT